MKVTPDDPKLSAYLLGELPSEEAAIIERAVAADPALRLSLDELEKTTGFLGDVFKQGGGKTLLPTQREAVRRAGREAASLGKVVELASARRSLKPWLGALGAAAAVAFAALLMSRVEPGGQSIGKTDAGVLPDEIALLPMPGPTVGAGSTSVGSLSNPMAEQVRNMDSRPGEFLADVARHLDRTPLPDRSRLPVTGNLAEFDGGPETRLPVVVGNSSLRWVSGWIREKQQLPPRSAVRIEELINSSSLSGGEEVEGLRLRIESMKCPWDSGSVLVGVQVKAGAEAVRDLKLAYRSGLERRVIGSFSTRGDSRLPTVLPAGRSTLVMLELQAMDENFGEIEIRLGDRIHLRQLPDPVEDASAGMRHASALAGFGMWLRDEGVGSAKLREMLEAATEDQDSVRTEVRRMMSEALKLENPKR